MLLPVALIKHAQAFTLAGACPVTTGNFRHYCTWLPRSNFVTGPQVTEFFPRDPFIKHSDLDKPLTDLKLV